MHKDGTEVSALIEGVYLDFEGCATADVSAEETDTRASKVAKARRRRTVTPAWAREMTEIMKLVTRIGPNLGEIARRTGIHKETVRYRYKSFISKGGRRVHAIVDREALGLRHVAVRTRFGTAYKGRIHEILAEMYRFCYLAGYDKELGGDRYIISANVPAEHVGGFKDFFLKLQEIGILKGVRVFDCGYWRHATTKVELYDFERDEWRFDWSNPPMLAPTKQPLVTRGELDDIDLLLLKELQEDADRSLIEIGKAMAELEHLRVHPRTLAYHYQKHVKNPGVIAGYTIGWPNTHFTDAHRKVNRALLKATVIVTGLTHTESAEIRTRTNSLPFLAGEAIGEDYYGKLVFPVEIVNDAMNFLGSMLDKFGDRGSIFLVDQRDSASFMPFHGLYDETRKAWRFDEENTLALFDKLAREIMVAGEESLVPKAHFSPRSTET